MKGLPMKKQYLSLVVAFALTLIGTNALASGNELAYKRVGELDTLLAASIASGDLIPIWDASTNKVKSVDATAFPYGGGAITLDDGSGASPSLILKDGTDETATFSKVDAGYLTLTTDATDGLNILTGSLKVGNGVPTNTVNGEDAYVEGGLEVDGATLLDGAVNMTSTIAIGGTGMTSTAAELNYNDVTTLGTLAASKAWTSDASLDTIVPTGGLATFQSGSGLTLNTGSVLVVEGATVNKQQLALPGRATIYICGDGTTINNNTVYYGPSMVPVAGAGRVCDITQVGNVTEATADEKAFDATAFQVLSMDCLTADPGAAGVSFTLRSAAAATTPSVTCTTANTKLGCTANVQTTTAIASGATIAIAAASTGNQGATPFSCAVQVAY